MKRKSGILLFSVSLLALGCISLSACDNDDDDNTKKPTTGEPSVKLNGLDAYYTPSDTINWSNVTLTVTYADGVVNELTKGLFDVEPSELKEIQEFVLDTSSLYTYSISGSSIPEGNYDLYYYVRSNEPSDTTIYTGYLTSIIVAGSPTDVYEVESFKEPSFLTTYKRNLTRVNESNDGEESEFYEAPSVYTVGDDNPFKFHPTLELSYSDGSSSEHITPSNYAVEVTVTHAGTALDIDDNVFVSYNNFEFDFTENAVGETFTISVLPKYFTADWAGYKIDPVTMTVKVEDGWNAYSAIDLGRINLVDPNFKYEEYVEYYKSANDVFWSVDESTGASSFESRVYHEIWEEFLTSKEETNLELISGIYLHDDIKITNDDIPEDFIITEAEATANSSNYEDMVGSIRDGVIIYNHLMENNFTLNGNLFSLDASSLKWGMTRVDFSNNRLSYLSESNPTVSEGNSVLFCFDDAVPNTWFTELPNNGGQGFFTRPDDWPQYQAQILNLETEGNMNRSSGTVKDNDSELASGCMTFAKSTGANTVINNSIIKHYLVAGYAEKTEEAASFYCLEMDHVKVFDCYGCAFVVWCSSKSTISNSVVKRLGGPIVLIESAKESKESGEDGYNPGFQMSGFTIGDNVTIENPLSGSEAWFTIYGLNTYITYINMINDLFTGEKLFTLTVSGLSVDVASQGYGKTFYDSNNDNKFTIVEVTLDRYMDRGYDIYTDFTYQNQEFEYDAGMDLDSDDVDTHSLTYLINTYYNDSSVTSGFEGVIDNFPVFETNTGKIFAPNLKYSLGYSGGLVLNASLNFFDLDAYYNSSAESKNTDDYGITLTEEDTFAFMYLIYGNVILSIGFELYDYVAE